ncbi:MAG: GNAT family N-acetyltransferase [Gammaproteobacteria bacterium]
MPVVLATRRLIVRQFATEDAAALHLVCGDRRTMRLVGDGYVLSRDRCAQWINESLIDYATAGYGAWAVSLADDPAIVGYCGIVAAPRRRDPEIIYALRPLWWGQGLASELVRALIEHGFATCGLRRLVATIRPENHASVRVVEKAGMHCAGEELAAEGILMLVYALDAPAS